MKSKINKKWEIAAVITATLCLYLFANAVSIWRYSAVSEDKSCDVAIVLGAACTDSGVSEVYKQRLNYAAMLYRESKAGKIIVTGGKGEGNIKTDASVAKAYLESCGIASKDIIEEGESKVTHENLINSKAIMDENGFKTALIVSDPLHMKRSMLAAKDAGVEAYSSPTRTSAYKSVKAKAPFIVRESVFYILYKWYRVFK